MRGGSADDEVTPELDCPVADDDASGRPDGVPASGVRSATGSITQVAATLVLEGEVDAHLCQSFRSGPRDLSTVSCVDARRVTFFGSPGLSLLADVARVRGVGVPVWASHAARRALRVTGLEQLFDVRPTT